ncbi:hypothetical protein ES319_D07G207200v1 [Gossypium barbadense]|uniref:ER lumen protein-retaining receptor n=1 Tax=Gossypium barbadense TaxID=3634 RepID=A0A5J5NFG2_GOSBA|nr:hypothetical protein [Gossypium barbadense]KAB2022390.1 hypothetical protein ES319_D07G207200v1 [Gossypium barbadense]
MRTQKRSIHAVSMWVRRQPPKVKTFLAVVSGMAALVLLRVIVNDHDNLFVTAEAVHFIGISVIIYKLTKEKTCTVLALCIHPTTSHNLLNRISWAFCAYLEAVSVLPQLRVMQNTKIVEPFIAHYVFALGVARQYRRIVLRFWGRKLSWNLYLTKMSPSLIFIRTLLMEDCYQVCTCVLGYHQAPLFSS